MRFLPNLILDPIERRLLKQSLRHFLIVIGFFFFAILLDLAVRGCEELGLVSSQLADGMESTALFIFQVDRIMIYYMVSMASFRLMIEFTKRLWRGLL
jgi:hypothetical protein